MTSKLIFGAKSKQDVQAQTFIDVLHLDRLATGVRKENWMESYFLGFGRVSLTFSPVPWYFHFFCV